MPNYRRSREGSLYFFTVVAMDRRPIFAEASPRSLLRQAFDTTCRDRPWITEGVVLLPDHLHMIWRLPEGDVDYSSRLAAIKKRFTRAFLKTGGRETEIPPGQQRHRRRGVWQQRFWEHTIRDAEDFRLHLDYIHLNPVRHGLTQRPVDWPHSSFARYVKAGWYEADWCGRAELPDAVEYLWPV